MRKNYQVIFKNLIFSTIGIIISFIFRFVNKIILGRVLGPENYGLLSIGITIEGFFNIFSVLGLNGGLRIIIPSLRIEEKNKKISSILSFILIFVTSIGILSGIVIFFLARTIAINIFDSIEALPIIKIFAIAIPFVAIRSISFIIQQAFENVKYQALFEQILSNLALSIIFLSFLVLDLGVIEASYVYLFVYILLFIASIYSLKKIYNFHIFSDISSFKFSLYQKDLRKIFSFSWPTWLVRVAGYGLTRFNVFIIGYYLNTFEVGLYSSALPVEDLVRVFLTALVPIFLPVISRLITQDKKFEAILLYKNFTRFVLTLTTPVIIFNLIFSKEIIRFMYGNDYSSAYIVLIIFVLLILIDVLSGPLDNMLLGLGKVKAPLINTIISTSLTVFFSFLLIPKYGIGGAASASFIGFFAKNVIGVSELYFLDKIFIYDKNFIKVIFTSLIVYLLSSLCKNSFLSFSLFVQFVSVGIIIITSYILSIYLIKAYSVKDQILLETFENKFKINLKFLKNLLFNRNF